MIDLRYGYDPFIASISSSEENPRLINAMVEFTGFDGNRGRAIELDSDVFEDLDDAVEWVLGTIDECRYSLTNLSKKVMGVM